MTLEYKWLKIGSEYREGIREEVKKVMLMISQ